jgi:hypothetical protein
LTHTLPLDLADAISGLEAVPPVGAEADFLAVLPADELPAGAVAAAAEVVAGAEAVAGAEVVAGAEAVLAAADFRLLVFAAGASEALDAGAEVAGEVASALADFLLALGFFAVVVSDDSEAFAGAEDSAVESVPVAFWLLLLFLVVVASEAPDAGLDSAVESALADFLLLLLFLVVVVSDEPALLVEAEVWSAAPLPEDFFCWLDLDLLEPEEVSAPLASELALVSDFVLFLDFLLDAFVSLPAVAWSSLAVVSFFDFFLVLLVDDAVWSSAEPLWVCAVAGAIPSPNSRHRPTATVSTLILSVLIPIPSLDFEILRLVRLWFP